MNNILVSIIVPTYNRAELLKITIQSILSQSYKNFELLIVSDKSTDNTKSVINSFNDKRIKFFELKRNYGYPAKPRNYGLKKSKGKFIAFCDDDDIWEPDKLKIQLNLMVDKGLNFTFTDIYCFNNNIDNKKIQQKRKLALIHNLGLRWPILIFNLVSNATVMISRNLFKKVGFLNEDVNLRAVEDYEYWIRCFKKSDGYFINKRLLNYRIHDNRISNDDEGKSKRKYIFHSLYKKKIINKFEYLISFLKI